MSQLLRKHPVLVFASLLLLSALACQAPAALQTQSTPDSDVVTAAAVATIEARTASPPEPAASGAVTTIDSNLEAVLTGIYQRLNPSVVHIFSFGGFGELSTGSGFLFDAQGHIVTNNHVVAGGSEYEVAFVSGDRVRATIVGTDIDSDLAVLKLERIPDGIVPFRWAAPNPCSRVSLSSRSETRLVKLARCPSASSAGWAAHWSPSGTRAAPAAIRCPGCCKRMPPSTPETLGGPLLNLQGEVVGVNSAILTRTGTNSGVGFSIPVEAVARIVPALIAEGSYTYPFMGISMAPPLTLDTLEEWDLPVSGIYVSSVSPETPAADAGLIGSVNRGGDYIIAVDGNSVRDSSELIAYLVFETEVGQTINLTIVRDGEERVVPLTLGARP